jgi:hypothetical protein
MIQAFQPAPTRTSTTALAVTGSNQTLTLLPNGGAMTRSMRLANIGTQTVFVALGTVTSSVTTSMPILANSVEVFTLPASITTLSVIADGTGSTLYATIGDGV